MTPRLTAVSLLALLLATACKDTTTSLDLGGPPAIVAVVSGSNQSEVRGKTLPQPLVAVVTDVDGKPSPAVRITWSVTGGTITPAADSTRDDGLVTATWTLPSTPGSYQASATAQGLGSAVFQATATGPATVTRAFGNNQGGTAGTALAQPLVVTVRDPSGRAVPAEQVTWTVTGGAITPATSTDPTGAASATWLLPTQVGRYQATARVASLGPVTFDAEARPAGYPLVFRYVDAGSYHSCGITAAEEWYCWGYNGDGQLGLPIGAPVLFPTLVPDLERFRFVTGGRYHSCGITLSGEVACWGENKDGRLGERLFATTFQHAQAGYVHSCALSLAREVWCWGYNGEGELSQNPATVLSSATPCLVPMTPCGQAGAPGGVRYEALAVNGLHSCAIRESGQVDCWGFGAEGQLGNGGTATMLVPTPVAGAVVFRTDPTVAPPPPDPDFPLPPGPFIAAGYAHTCAIGMDDKTYCWGLNQDGQLGTGGTASSLVPVAVTGTPVFVQVTTGQRHSCGLTVLGQAHCWGDNTFGQIGDGTTTRRLAPTPVAGGLVFAYLKAGELHTCGVTTTGAAHCWGDNEYGQLGLGTRDVSLVPAKVVFQP
jgi:alpha-tubulin suppressor-like RCC1 family protein